MSQQFDSRPESEQAHLTDDGVQQMLLLAERLRESSGGVLDDAAILAVSEATGAPPEYVRLALKMRPQKKRASLTDKIRNDFLTLEPDTRRYVAATAAAVATGSFLALGARFGDQYQIYGLLTVLAITGGLYNVAVSKDTKIAAFSGALLAGLSCVSFAVLAALLKVSNPPPTAILLIPLSLAGGLCGLIIHKLVDSYRGKIGLSDPVKERQDLLRQLVDIQDRLRSGEQAITFLSVDIVGSTRMKSMADPLSVEFTFTEYHKFVEMIAKRYGGRLHSTAGDGMTLAFDSPGQAFGAARTCQTGIIELNTFRNKIGVPIVLRCGIHTGKVVAPDATDVTSINFAEVIDIAAHLQKVCPAGGIAVSEASAERLPGGINAVGTERVSTDGGVTGFVWLPKSAVKTLAPGSPPPLPAE